MSAIFGRMFFLDNTGDRVTKDDIQYVKMKGPFT